MVVAHTFNPSTQEAEAGGSLSLRTARVATQRHHVTNKPSYCTLLRKFLLSGYGRLAGVCRVIGKSLLMIGKSLFKLGGVREDV